MKLLTTLALVVLTVGCASTPAPSPAAPTAPPDKTLRGPGDRSTVGVVITMKIKPEVLQDYLEMAAKVVNATYQEEPGVLTLTMYKHPTEPNTYVWIERYRDATAREGHQKTTYMAEAHAKLPGWLAGPPTVVVYNQALPR